MLNQQDDTHAVTRVALHELSKSQTTGWMGFLSLSSVMLLLCGLLIASALKGYSGLPFETLMMAFLGVGFATLLSRFVVSVACNEIDILLRPEGVAAPRERGLSSRTMIVLFFWLPGSWFLGVSVAAGVLAFNAAGYVLATVSVCVWLFITLQIIHSCRFGLERTRRKCEALISSL